jgi:osmotically inducible protein OsmC
MAAPTRRPLRRPAEIISPTQERTMAAIRTAEVTWNGSLVEGSGTIDHVTSGAFARLPVTWASRTEAADGRTSPEELVAAAHASCYAMAFSGRLTRNGTPPTSLNVKATVIFDKQEAGWRVASSALTVRGNVPGLDAATFGELAEAAKDGCPISQALKGNVELSVEATLEG